MQSLHELFSNGQTDAAAKRSNGQTKPTAKELRDDIRYEPKKRQNIHTKKLQAPKCLNYKPSKQTI